VRPLMSEPVNSIALIREPIEWLGSWYRYRQRGENLNTSSSTADVSFDEFVEAYLGNDRPKYANVGQQAQFITGGGDKPLVTQLWRYTAIDDLTLYLRLQLGFKFKLEQVNVSPKRALSLSPENNRTLQSHFQKDFDLYENAIGG